MHFDEFSGGFNVDAQSCLVRLEVSSGMVDDEKKKTIQNIVNRLFLDGEPEVFRGVQGVALCGIRCNVAGICFAIKHFYNSSFVIQKTVMIKSAVDMSLHSCWFFDINSV